MTMSNECKEEIEFADAKNIAQIVAGTAFIALSFWMIFANTAKLAVARKADLSQRYNIAVTICTAVALFSGFFNILQLTKVQQFALPRPTQFTVDLARPVEWICTCPILQLALVILGGTRLPPYRKYSMPLLSVAILLCGTASMFTESALRWAWYGFGSVLMIILFYWNIQQIKENSDGAESFYRGSSDFRILTIILIVLWFPFPFWFMISPEGFGWVHDVLTINLGWAVLNITAKFSFIIYLQLAKLRYSSRKEAAQELYAVQPAENMLPPDKVAAWPAIEDRGVSQFDVGGGFQDLRQGYAAPPMQKPQVSEKLAILVTEAMVTLGLAQHTDRFLGVLQDQGITSMESLERLNQDRCMDLGLPWNLVQATQRRWVTERMTLADELDGEPLDPNAVGVTRPGEPEMAWRQFPQGPPSASFAGPYPGPGNGNGYGYGPVTDDRLRSIEAHLQRLLEKVDNSRDAVLSRVSNSYVGDKMEPAEFVHIGERLAGMMQKMEASREEMQKHIDNAKDEILQSLNKELRGVGAQVEASRTEVTEQVRRHVDAARDELLEKVATYKVDILEKVGASEEHLMQRVVLVGQNVELSKEVFLQRTSFQEGASNKMDGWKQELIAQLEAANQRVMQQVTAGMDHAQGLKTEVVQAVRSAEDHLQRSIDAAKGDVIQKVDASDAAHETSRREVDSKLAVLVSKADSHQEILLRTQNDTDSRFTSLLNRVQGDTEKHQRTFAEHFGELLDKLLRAQEDHMIDIRRMNMMVMENVNSAQERAQHSIDMVASRVSSLAPIRETSRVLSGGRHEEDASDVGSVVASLGRGGYGDHVESYSHE